MSDERKLHDAIILDSQWLEATRETLANRWEQNVQVEHYGTHLIHQVVRDQISVYDLRKGVTWVSALDGEAVAASGGDIEALIGEDYLEATARRICHQAGRLALNSVKSNRRLLATKVNYFYIARSQSILNA